jgi:hypothetical protein
MDTTSAANTNSGEESAIHGKVFKILVIGETGSGEYYFVVAI